MRTASCRGPFETCGAPRSVGRCGVCAATFAGTAHAAREQMANSEQAQRSLNAVREHMKPYTFHCAPDECEMSVTIKVPPETKTTDCLVEIKRDSLKVCVKGHALQLECAQHPDRHGQLLRQRLHRHRFVEREAVVLRL